MLKIIVICLLWPSIVFAGFPPTTAKGQLDSTQPTTFNIQVPQFQATRVGSTTALLETGNKNLLANASFEGTTIGSAWSTGVGATVAVSTSTFVEGKQSALFTLSSTNGLITNQAPSSPLYIANFQASAWIKTTLTTVQVCSALGATVQQCVSAPSDGVWHQVVATMASDGVSLPAIVIQTTGSSTGTLNVDAAYVGLNQNIGTAQQASFLGAIAVTACASNWTTSSTTIASFAAQTSCVYTPSGSASAPSTMIPAIKFASIPAGEILIVADGSFNQGTTAKNSTIQMTDGTNTSLETPSFSSSGGVLTVPTMSFRFSYSTPQSNVTLQMQGRTDSGGSTNIYAISGYNLTLKVYYFPSQSQIVTPNTLSTLGMLFMSPTATCPAGSVLADGGTTPSSLVSIYGANLPDARGLALSFAGTRGTAIAGITYSRTLLSAQGDQLQGHSHLTNSSSSAGSFQGQYFGTDNGGNNALGANGTTSPTNSYPTDGTNGTPRVGTETRMANIAFTPCISTATEAVPLLVNSVLTESSGVVKIVSFGTGGATDGSSCTSSPCAIYRSNSSGVSMTRSATGRYTIAFAAGTFSAGPVCTASASSASQGFVLGPDVASSTSVVLNYNNSASAAADTAFNVVCVGPK